MLMLPIPTVLADIEDLIWIIIVVGMMFISWIAKLVKGNEEDKPAQRPRAQNDRLRSEIDAFLKEVSGAKGGAGGDASEVVDFEAAAAPTPRPQRQPQQQRQHQETQRQQAQRQRRTQQVKKAKRPRPGTKMSERQGSRSTTLGSSVREHVSDHMQSGTVDREVAQNVTQSVSEHLGARSASIFDRPEDGDEGSPIAGQLVAMLKSPEGVRQAILLNEILAPARSLRK